jgi:ATP-dependent DNA ligase
MNYENYRYIFPPRPENAVPHSEIDRYDNGLMLGQAKSNGSNCTIYTNGDVVYAMNRHGQPLTTFRLTKEEVIDNLYKCEKGKWLVINGEYMNKSKKDHRGNVFNHKLVVFDILVFNSEHLLGEKHDSRIKLLEKLYGTEESNISFYYKISDNIYLNKSYYGDFSKIYFDIINCDMIEGLVLKRKNAKLEPGTTEKNNNKSMIKFRKPTKNYGW